MFPLWLQQKHELLDQQLVLLNGTTIPYHKLTIPCCGDCNNGPLADLEKEVEILLAGPFGKMSAEEEFRIFQWCSKLYYGLLYREMSLVLNRKHSGAEPIVPKEFLSELSTFHLFLTSVRRPFKFQGFLPYSLFVFEIASKADIAQNFDYIDTLYFHGINGPRGLLFLAVQTGCFGIICVFQDNGLQKQNFQDEFDRWDGIPVHPVQFLEFASKSLYKHSLLTFTPRYTSISEDDDTSEVVVLPMGGGGGDAWHDWNQTEYARAFVALLRQRGYLGPEDIFEGEDCPTYLRNEDGSRRQIEG